LKKRTNGDSNNRSGKIADFADVLKAEYVVISVMGPHAGESETEIFERKIKEIQN
jgi:hypothetical protein